MTDQLAPTQEARAGAPGRGFNGAPASPRARGASLHTLKNAGLGGVALSPKARDDLVR